MKPAMPKVVLAGLAGGLCGNGVLGVLFTSEPVQAVLYNPAFQSQLFLEITPNRNVPVSVAGLVILSVIPAWLFAVFQSAVPGKTTFAKGLFWGLTIWLMFWVFQEWFIYHTLLKEPLWLNFLELAILLVGSLVQGVVMVLFLWQRKSHQTEHHASPNEMA